jgi:hypothetical protein
MNNTTIVKENYSSNLTLKIDMKIANKLRSNK